MSTYHIPVMPKESIELLNVQKGHWYIDCNLGGGGHTEEILKRGGKVIGIDLDPDAINEVAKNHHLTVTNENYHLQAYSENLILYQSNFANIDIIINDIITCHPEFISGSSTSINNPQQNDNNRPGKMLKPVQHDKPGNLTIQQFNNLTISGVLFDLGVSTYQLDEGSRGFSINQDFPLDMRMNPTQGATAKDLVNGLYEKELAELFLKFGEENFAKPIARKIVEYRKTKLIETTAELANIVLSVRRRSPTDRTHPATRIFQALRIVVNDELNSLEEALPKAFEILEPGGRLVVISFHSLEDRIVKNYFRKISEPFPREGHSTLRNESSGSDSKSGDPSNNHPQAQILTDKPIETSEEESTENPRSRSAKLRAVEKNL